MSGLSILSLRRQCHFCVSGVSVGVAEIMNDIILEKPIGLTTGLVEKTAAFEQTVVPGKKLAASRVLIIIDEGEVIPAEDSGDCNQPS